MPRLTTIAGMRMYATRKPISPVTIAPTTSGASQHTISGKPETASVPLSVASTPIREPTEMSMLPEMITIDMPIAATAM